MVSLYYKSSNSEVTSLIDWSRGVTAGDSNFCYKGGELPVWVEMEKLWESGDGGGVIKVWVKK